jgi:hypothetical protein
MSKRRIFWVIVAIPVVAFLGAASRSTLSYSATCPRCLQHAGGVEKSIFGVIFSRKVVQRQSSGGLGSPDAFDSPAAPVDPRLYEEISGHPCDHMLMRGGFCRYSGGGVGCGLFGDSQRFEFRNAIAENLYRAYLRVPDKPLARETFELVDQLFPIRSGTRAASVPMRHTFEAEARPNEPLSILMRGLGLVSSVEEWREVLNAARAGDGSLALLNDLDLLTSRLDSPDPAVRVQAIDLLAAMNQPGAWTAVATCLDDPQVGLHASERIVWRRYLPLFDAVLEAAEKALSPDERIESLDSIPEPLRDFVTYLEPDEIRSLLSQQRPRVDLLCLAAIQKQEAFDFLDEVVDLLNRRPTVAAAATVEILFEGSDTLG